MTDLKDARTATTPAAIDVLDERRRQIEAEGFTVASDDRRTLGELSCAAMGYAQFATFAAKMGGSVPSESLSTKPPSYWPFARSWWKPTTARRALVKAGALILAEIERIDRAADQGTKAR